MATASPNILVVEDDRETRTLIAKYLRTNACNVTTATDGREMARAMIDHRVDLLCAGERIVALIETIAEPEALLIENVAVSPACQGRGLGRRLMAHAERLATAMGYGEIRLYTNARFVDNVALYQRLGYAIAREESFLGGRVAHMSKRLPPA